METNLRSVVWAIPDAGVHLQKIREYCDYLERHVEFVCDAWAIVQERCPHIKVVWDDFLFWETNARIIEHDLSKLSQEEFIPYQKTFYPVDPKDVKQNDQAFQEAWENHKICNAHHWEHWTKSTERFPCEHEVDCVCMVCDWMAMSMERGQSFSGWYFENKDSINIPTWAKDFVEDIFFHVEKVPVLQTNQPEPEEVVINLPRYKCHKEVKAARIKKVYRKSTLNSPRLIVILSDGGEWPVPVSTDYMAKHKPYEGGYYVEYEDGYASFSPPEPFESGYTLIEGGEESEA